MIVIYTFNRSLTSTSSQVFSATDSPFNGPYATFWHMNKLAAIRSALIPHAAEIAEVISMESPAKSATAIEETTEIYIRAIVGWLRNHPHIVFAIAAAWDDEDLNLVSRRPVNFVIERLFWIARKELSPAGIDIGLIRANLESAVGLSNAPIPGEPVACNVIPFVPRRER